MKVEEEVLSAELPRNSTGILAALVLGLPLSGCVHYMPAAVSSTSIGSAYEVPVKVVAGHSSEYYVFGIGPTGDASLRAAIEDAKSQAKSDSIANVFVDRVLYCFPFCSFAIVKRIDTAVYGTLVRYTDEHGEGLAEHWTAPAAKHLSADTGSSSRIMSDEAIEAMFKGMDKGTRVRVLLLDGTQFISEFRYIEHNASGGFNVGLRPAEGGPSKVYQIKTIDRVDLLNGPGQESK